MPDFLTDKEEIGVVYKVAKTLGIEAKLTSENPATKSGQTAEMLMAGITTERPEIAARLRARAGQVPSLEALAAQHGFAEMSPQARQSLMASDEKFVRSSAADAQAEEARLLAAMAAGADQLARANRGDRRVDIENAIAAAQNTPEAVRAREEQRRYSMELAQKIKASQARHRQH